MTENVVLFGIVLFPLLGGLVNGLLGARLGRQAVHFTAVASVALSFACAIAAFKDLWVLRAAGEASASLSYTAYEWFSLDLYGKPLPIPVRFVMDSLSGVMTLVVTGIGLLIHIYSTGYMSEEKSYARFFCYLNLFTASMLILVLGSSLPLMFVGWEGVGVCSYLLIGFWYETSAYAAAGRKAFVANRIGDFGVLIGMFLLAVATGSLEFDKINEVAVQNPAALASSLTLGPTGAPLLTISALSLATVATLFLFLGCTGKSAQIPLFVWLPDAMAGPTPVSALIHAATMVTSGIYLICRLSPVFALAPYTMAVIAVVGACTALMAACVGLVQNDIKKILAYSTVSQLGFMFAGVGCYAFAAGFMHVFTHAFFKACLFLGAGSVMHAVGAHGDADIRRLGGLRKYMPTTHWTFLVSCLAIAGVPLFSGFFSKDEILVGALAASHHFPFAPWLGPVIFGMLVIGATMTAFYMFRLYFLTFTGEYRGGPVHDDHGAHAHDDHAHDDHAHAHAHHDPHESPAPMTIPLVVLGIGAIVTGYVWVGIAHYQPWVDWLAPALAKLEMHHESAQAFTAMGFGTAACVIGIYLAYAWYFRGSETPKRLAAAYPGLHQLLMDKWRIDELYDATVLGASRGLATLSAAFDKYVVDGLVSEATTLMVRGGSYVATRMQTGLVHTYGAVMTGGLLLCAFHFVIPHVGVEISEPEGTHVSLEADKGLAYSYRWDLDGDGTFDTEWSSSGSLSHDFAATKLDAFAAVIETADDRRRELPRLQLGRTVSVSAKDLGADWQVGEDKTLPTITVSDAGLVVRPNGARVRKGSESFEGEAEVTVSRGEHVRIGDARLSVTGVVRPTLEVRNVFGMERKRSLELILPKVEPRVRAEILSQRGDLP